MGVLACDYSVVPGHLLFLIPDLPAWKANALF